MRGAQAFDYNDEVTPPKQDPLYEAPPEGKKLLSCYGILFSKLSSSQKAVLGCLVKHAHPRTGRCHPGQARIARMTGLSKSTVERAVASLCETPYLSRQRREHYSTNAYRIGWSALMHDFKECEKRGGAKIEEEVIIEDGPF